MKQRMVVILLFALLAAICGDVFAYTVEQGTWQNQTVSYIRGQLVFKKAKNATETQILQLLAANDATLIRGLDAKGIGVAELDPSDDTITMATLANQSALIAWAQPDLVAECYSTDPYLGVQWAVNNTPADNYTGVNAEFMWPLTTGDPSVVVGVLDTSLPIVSQAGDSTIDHDDLEDFNLVNYHQLDHVSGTDDAFHGLAVAGVIAAKHNGQHLAGIAPGVTLEYTGVTNDVDVIPTSDIWTAGADLIVNHGVDILNFSIGHTYDLDWALMELMNTARNNDVLVVCAAGDGNEVSYPSYLYWHDEWYNVISVGAAQSDETVASYSPSGAGEITMVAPGGEDTDLWTTEIACLDDSPTFGLIHGTSIAAAHVTGIAALMKSLNPTLTVGSEQNSYFQDALEASCYPIDDPVPDAASGYGLIDVELALTAAAQTAPDAKGGTLASSETWSDAVFLTGGVTVPNGVTLTIDPGTTVYNLMQWPISILITVQEGGVVDIGSLPSAYDINFTYGPNSQYVTALHFDEGSGSGSTVYGVNFANISTGIWLSGTDQNPVDLADAIKGCYFMGYAYDVVGYYGDVGIEDCSFWGNSTRSSVVSLLHGELSIDQCWFEFQEYAEYLDDVVYAEDAGVSITNSDFYIDSGDQTNVLNFDEVPNLSSVYLSNTNVHAYYHTTIPGFPPEPQDFSRALLIDGGPYYNTTVDISHCRFATEDYDPSVYIRDAIADIHWTDFQGGDENTVKSGDFTFTDCSFVGADGPGLRMYYDSFVDLAQSTNHFEGNGWLEQYNAYSGSQIYVQGTNYPDIEDGYNNIIKAPETTFDTYCIGSNGSPSVTDVANNYWGQNPVVTGETFDPFTANIQNWDQYLTAPAPFRQTLAMDEPCDHSRVERERRSADQLLTDLASASRPFDRGRTMFHLGLAVQTEPDAYEPIVAALQAELDRAETSSLRLHARHALCLAMFHTGHTTEAEAFITSQLALPKLTPYEIASLEEAQIGLQHFKGNMSRKAMSDAIDEYRELHSADDLDALAAQQISAESGTLHSSLPEEFALTNAYPNPFNPTTTVQVSLPASAALTVTVHNTLGQTVATLADGSMSAGTHSLVLDGTNLASGVYLVRAHVPGELNATRKVVLMK